MIRLSTKLSRLIAVVSRKRRPRLGEVIKLCPIHGVRMYAGKSEKHVTRYYCGVCRSLGRARGSKQTRPT